ncbi:unnamed protein product [Brachionus calyciflorus]|uniref:Uncharacterized protein n=1 Tax=Brachionus calyciflorus TaxID=104777 RepID=A0A814KGN7_9BILA|nr:unnamed protein product [Brachionus calyciflorus]
MLLICERSEDKQQPKSLSAQEIQDIVRKALSESSETDSQTINIVNIQDKVEDCPDLKREIEREEFLKTLTQPPIQRPDSAHSFIESISEIKEIEETHEPLTKDLGGYQPNPKNDERVKQILKDLLDETKPAPVLAEPRYVLTKVTKYITKRLHTEKQCECK